MNNSASDAAGTSSVLIAYATKHGATAEIAGKIGEGLRGSGVAAQVLPADHVHDLTPYTAVVLGSAVYAGHWRKAAVRFLTHHESQLADRPVWLFSSGPTGAGDPSALMKGWRFPEAQQPIADRIRPRDIAFFHGKIDLGKLTFFERLVVRTVKAPTGDFRDWNAIAAWAKAIADTTCRQPR